ncbi:MFS transporter permease [Halomonas sp. NO4]|uniref:MFS transporter permease n=1 Tax=Halomonas sp. NO4 TaxID=2484813 RepID=UPI0013D6D00F|nr:MFS transporter permease [Halomonas sp. NO4]
MKEWLSYRPGDFLMFSQRVYERLFVLHNEALWPLPLLALALGAALLLALAFPRPGRVRAALGLLGLAWAFVAWAFLWQRYAPINWGIRYVVPLFALQALLLALGLWRGGLKLPARWDLPRGLGVALVAYAVFLHPLTALLHGRGLAGAEVVGLAPDPLAIATLGVAAMARPASRGWALLAIPALWCLASAATLYLLDSPAAWPPLLAVLVALAARLLPRDSPPASRNSGSAKQNVC